MALQEARESSAVENVITTQDVMHRVQSVLKEEFGASYSQAMINKLFFHPYTKIGFLMRDLEISRPTAGSYLNRMEKKKLLRVEKMGRSNFYVNTALLELFLPKASL